MKRSCSMFIGLFATVFGGDGYSQGKSADPAPALYVARTIRVAPQTRESYLACLQSKEAPVWRDLKKQGVLADQSVYETTHVDTVEQNVPEWNFLLLSHLASSASPQSFLAAEDDRLGVSPKSSRCADTAGAGTLRVEVLRSTPNSYYPRVSKDDDQEALKEKVSYMIEYIAVHDTPEALNQYRENMRTYNGPALDIMIRQKALFSFVALETVSVLFARPGMPNWNQIHFNGLSAAQGEKYREAWQAASRQLDPNRTVEGDVALLNRLRTRPRIDMTKELFELAVH
jgi:hypothetical protein